MSAVPDTLLELEQIFLGNTTLRFAPLYFYVYTAYLRDNSHLLLALERFAAWTHVLVRWPMGFLALF